MNEERKIDYFFPCSGIVRVCLAVPGKEVFSSPAIALSGENPSIASGSSLEEEISFSLQGSEVFFEGLVLRITPSGFDLALDPKMRCYGLGEKTGYLDKRGRAYSMWNTDNPDPHLETLDPMYVSIPWLILFQEGRAWGLFLDDFGHTHWDVGKKEPELLSMRTPREILDLYLIAGPTLQKVVQRYTLLTGRISLPPRWALGYQQSRWSYPSAERILEIAKGFREKEIPCDVLYADVDYMDGFRDFTWDPEAFPEPAGLVRELGREGFKLVPIVDPGIKQDLDYPVFMDGLKKGMFCLDEDGKPYIGEVWPGKVVFPDFLRPEVRRWWGDWHGEFLKSGIAGIWNDMNEPGIFDTPTHTMPLDVRHGDGTSHLESHNLYGFCMNRATHAALEEQRPGARPFLLSRSGFAGIQRYAAVWTGDNFSIWPHLEQSLPMLFNLGLSGLPFVGADVGGFSGDCSGELLVRWTQLGAFYPFFRNHSAIHTRDQEPWAFGPEVEELCRRAIRLRYELLPYFYTNFFRASLDGTPLFRPLVFDFSEDPSVEAIFDQAMVGPCLMIAPVCRPQTDHRAVYFPQGEWIDFWSNERISGGGWRLVHAPLERIPVFAKAGAVIPRGEWASSVERIPDTLVLEVFPGKKLSGEFYQDDGTSLAYREGDFFHLKMSGECREGKMKLRLEAIHGSRLPQKITFLLRGVEKRNLRIDADFSEGEWLFEDLEY